MSARVLGVFATLLFVLQPSPAHSVQFAARQDIATHFQRLTGLAVADFNGDGKLDIAVTDDYSQALVVYPGDGTGKFGSPVTTTLNVPGIGGLGSLVAGDVNEDGKQDLIVAPVAGLQYDVVLFGKGDGTFTQSSQIMTSYGFQSASLIDINSDKHLDLIAGGNGSLYVHLGDGKGNFAQQSITSFGDLYLGLTVGDFNGDKNADFVATSFRFNTLVSYLGKGNGTFQAPQNSTTKAISDPASITSADFNGDGKLDLLVGSADVASLLLGNGDGTFQTGVYLLPIAPVPSSSVAQVGPAVATADLDGDGTADVVAADDGSNKVSVLLNDGTGNSFSKARILVRP